MAGWVLAVVAGTLVAARATHQEALAILLLAVRALAAAAVRVGFDLHFAAFRLATLGHVALNRLGSAVSMLRTIQAVLAAAVTALAAVAETLTVQLNAARLLAFALRHCF